MNYFLTAIFVSACVSVCVSAQQKFHESLSKEELQSIFHVESADQVPDYAITSIHSRVRRSTEGSHVRTIQLDAFGQKQTLQLTPNELLNKKVPVFFADASKDSPSVTFTPVSSTDDVGVPYQDESSMAAVLITHHPQTGALLMDGTVGEDLVVRPIPSSLVPSAKKGKEEEPSGNALYEDEAFLDDGEDLEDDLIFSDGLPLVADDEVAHSAAVVSHLGSEKNATKLPENLLLLRKRRSASSEGLHVVYKRKSAPIDTDFAFMEMDKTPLGKSRPKREKREAPYVIYPEILVLVDYDGYLLHGQDNNKIKSYYVSFWNGADLRYKLLKSPKVKVSIAGIIISRSRDAMPYLERNRVGRDAIDSASALTDMGKYLYQERRLPTYDVAVAITKYDLCRRRQSGECTTGTAGFAYVGGACVVNKRLKKVNSVAIVEDTGGFSGIIVAAHEVGHLLGAVHDGSPPPSYLGGPGARRCRWKDGYIMSDLRHTEKGFRWSSCSVEQFHHFLNGETAACLYNLPHEDESLPRILPGKLMSLDAQCRKDRGTSACFKDDRVCAQLFCFDKSSGYCVSYRPAAEGSDCGDGKICLNGKCAYDNDNSITDLDLHRKLENILIVTTPDSISESEDTQDNVKTTTQKSISKHVTTSKPVNTPTPSSEKFDKPKVSRIDKRNKKNTSKPLGNRNLGSLPEVTTKTPIKKVKETFITTKSPVTTERSTPSSQKPFGRPKKTRVTTERPSSTTRKPEITTKKYVPTTRKFPLTTKEPQITTRRPLFIFKNNINKPHKPIATTFKPPLTAFALKKFSTPKISSTTIRSTTEKEMRFTTERTKPKLFTESDIRTESPDDSNVETSTTKRLFNNNSRPTLKPWPVSSRLKSSNKPESKSGGKSRSSNSEQSRWMSWRSSFVFSKNDSPSNPTPTTERVNWWDRSNKRKTNKNFYTKSTAASTTTTTTTTQKPTTTRAPTKRKTNRLSLNHKKKELSVFGHGFKCEDLTEKIAGNMSCREFLKSYGLRYCNHRYIQKNCCKSRAEVCST